VRQASGCSADRLGEVVARITGSFSVPLLVGSLGVAN